MPWTSMDQRPIFSQWCRNEAQSSWLGRCGAQLGAGRGFQAALKMMVSDPKGSKSQNRNARRCQRITLDGEAMVWNGFHFFRFKSCWTLWMCSFCLRGSFILSRRTFRQQSFWMVSNGYGFIVCLLEWDSAVHFCGFHWLILNLVVFSSPYFFHISSYFPCISHHFPCVSRWTSLWFLGLAPGDGTNVSQVRIHKARGH